LVHSSAQFAQRVMQSGVHRPARNPDASGDLVNGQVRKEPQGHDDSVVRRQASHGPPDLVSIIDPRCLIAVARQLVGKIGRLSARLPAKAIPAGVDQDPMEPRLETIGIPQLAPPAPCGDQGIVGGVFGIRAVAKDRGRQSIARVEVSVSEANKGEVATARRWFDCHPIRFHGDVHDDMTTQAVKSFTLSS